MLINTIGGVLCAKTLAPYAQPDVNFVTALVPSGQHMYLSAKVAIG